MDTETVARLRIVIGRLARQLNASATGEGLTPSQASVLGLVAARGPLGLTELAALEGLNPTMLSRVVGKLDEAGLIQRLPDPTDLRAARVEVTANGREVNDRIRAQRARVVSECAARLPTEQRADLERALPAFEALAEELRLAVANASRR